MEESELVDIANTSIGLLVNERNDEARALLQQHPSALPEIKKYYVEMEQQTKAAQLFVQEVIDNNSRKPETQKTALNAEQAAAVYQSQFPQTSIYVRVITPTD